MLLILASTSIERRFWTLTRSGQWFEIARFSFGVLAFSKLSIIVSSFICSINSSTSLSFHAFPRDLPGDFSSVSGFPLSAMLSILMPRTCDRFGLRQESRATISGMRHRCKLRETGWAEFGYFLCYFKMVAPRALVFRPLVKGNEGSEIEIAAFSSPEPTILLACGRNRELWEQPF